MQMNNAADLDFSSTMSDAFDTMHTSDNTVTETATNTAVEAPDKAAPANPAEKADTEITDQSTSNEADPAAQPQPVEPPARWSAEDKAKFAALPREAQEMLLKRESDGDKLITQKTQEIADQKRQFDQLDQVLSPRRQQLISEYGSEAAGVHALLNISDFAARDPAGFVKWFAQQRGLDIGTLNNSTQAQSNQIDPVLAATQQKVEQLERHILSDAESKSIAAIEAFKNEMSSDGKPLYPHFDAVSVKMGKLMEIGEANTLKDAYDMAVFANPTTRAAILEEQRKAEEAKRHAEAKEAANNAKKAADINVSSKGAGGGSKALGSMEDTMRDAYDRITGAA